MLVGRTWSRLGSYPARMESGCKYETCLCSQLLGHYQEIEEMWIWNAENFTDVI